MINSKKRIGNFTSSEIVALTALAKDKKFFGVPALTYIQETNMERRLERSLTDECNAKPLTWGKLIEQRVFDEKLGIEYSFNSQETIVHPTIPYWCGSPDGFKYDKGKTVVDSKCPLTLKSFCKLVNPLYHGLTGMDAMNAIRNGFKDKLGFVHPPHKDGEKFYWQLVSNAIISVCMYAELIVYVPYESEIPDIRLLAQNVNPADLSAHYWIAMANDGELPFLKDDGYYKNINIIRFEVPQDDKDLLTSKVQEAGTFLVEEFIALPLAHHEPELSATIIEPLHIPFNQKLTFIHDKV